MFNHTDNILDFMRYINNNKHITSDKTKNSQQCVLDDLESFHLPPSFATYNQGMQYLEYDKIFENRIEEKKSMRCYSPPLSSKNR